MSRSENDKRLIDYRELFNAEPLIFVPNHKSHSHGGWFHLSDCAWDGPKCLQHTPCLQDFYPKLQLFFTSSLGIVEAGWSALVKEAKTLHAFASLERISEIFIALNDMFKRSERQPEDTKEEILSTLKRAAIFPIYTGKSESTFDYLSTAAHREQWYIADRDNLRRSFENHIPLFALSVEAIEKISTIIEKLDLRHRLLSELALGTPEIQGEHRPNESYTKALKQKAWFLLRYVHPQYTSRPLPLCENRQ
jgi:hypothetical protein